MVAQLEHQFRLGKLSSQGLWFFCQVLCACMHVLSVCRLYFTAAFIVLKFPTSKDKKIKV